MIFQYLRLRGPDTGVIHGCGLLEKRYFQVALGAGSASRIVAARQTSFRRPPAVCFEPLRGCQAGPIRWPLLGSRTECHSSQCQNDAWRPAAQAGIPLLRFQCAGLQPDDQVYDDPSCSREPRSSGKPRSGRTNPESSFPAFRLRPIYPRFASARNPGEAKSVRGGLLRAINPIYCMDAGAPAAAARTRSLIFRDRPQSPPRREPAQEELSAVDATIPAGTRRFWRNFPAITSNEKMRSLVFHANGSGIFDAGRKREMRGRRAPNATVPLDVRKVLRSMQVIDGFRFTRAGLSITSCL